MHKTLSAQELKTAMGKVIYRSTDWHALCIQLAQRLCVDGKNDEAEKYVLKVDESKLPDEYKANYYSLFARFAEIKSDKRKAIEHLKTALTLDRALPKPVQQFVLTKQIALIYDSLGDLGEAVSSWERLIDDFKNFEPSEHQPMLAYKFLSLTLAKMEKLREAKEAKSRWVARRTDSVLKIQKIDGFESSDPPPNYNDELTNYFERCRQNVFLLYASQKAIVEEMKKRNAQFWVGAESMRDKMADRLQANGKQHLSDEEQLPYFFFMRSISTYLTSFELAAGGRIPEAYGALRMCLENSFYAFHLAESPEHAATWLDRPTLGLGEIDDEKKSKTNSHCKGFWTRKDHK